MKNTGKIYRFDDPHYNVAESCILYLPMCRLIVNNVSFHDTLASMSTRKSG